MMVRFGDEVWWVVMEELLAFMTVTVYSIVLSARDTSDDHMNCTSTPVSVAVVKSG